MAWCAPTQTAGVRTMGIEPPLVCEPPIARRGAPGADRSVPVQEISHICSSAAQRARRIDAGVAWCWLPNEASGRCCVSAARPRVACRCLTVAVNDYAPASSLGWLDLDGAASERVATLLRSLEEPGTIDALGLGSIRDAFSDMLTPGTSTVQTRLRYFVFLPWIFQRLEAEGVPPANFARKLRDYEAKLIDCLRPLGSNQGVIGRIAGRSLRRMPSDIYWGSMAPGASGVSL